MADNSVINITSCAKRKAITPNLKKIAYNTYLKYSDVKLKTQAVKLASADVGISESSLYKILKEIETDRKTGAPIRKTKNQDFYSELNDEEKDAIKNTVHDFFENNVTPSVDNVLQAVQENKLIPKMTHDILYYTLNKLGFERRTIGGLVQFIPVKEVDKTTFIKTEVNTIPADIYSTLSKDQKESIKSIVLNFFKSNVTPSVDNILEVVQKTETIPNMSHASLIEVLKKLGFDRPNVTGVSHQFIAPREVCRYIPIISKSPKKRPDFYSKLGEAEKEAIKNIILDIFKQYKIASVDKVLKTIDEHKIIPKMSRYTMLKVLKKLGYKWQNIGGLFQFLPLNQVIETVPIKEEQLGHWEFFLCD